MVANRLSALYGPACLVRVQKTDRREGVEDDVNNRPTAIASRGEVSRRGSRGVQSSMYLAESSETRGGGRGRVVEVDVDVDVDAESRVGESWSDRYAGLLCGRGWDLSSKQAARSTQGNRRLSFDLGAWELVGRPGPCVCGMVEQARTREQTALGWLFWGVVVEGGRLGAGSRELGRELGSFTGGGELGLGWSWELELDFGPVGTIPTMGRFRWSQRLQHCMCSM